MQLYNKLSAKERAELIEEAGKDRLTLSFYQYAQIGNPQELRDHLFIKWDSLDVLGRIYVAQKVLMHNYLYQQIILKHLKTI